MASTMLALTILCISYFFSHIHASPLMMRDVFSPHITSPNETTVWPVGTQQMVTWETDNIPPDSQLTDPNGMIVLGHLGPTGGLNLDLENPLAQDFKLRVGHALVMVPSVPPRDDYIIVLFGDSGNTSPTFAITRIITDGFDSTTSTTKPSTITTVLITQHPSSATSISVIESTPSTGTTTTGGQSAANTPTTTLLVPSTTLVTSHISTQTAPTSSLSSLSSLSSSSPSFASSSVASAVDSAATTANSAWASHHLSAMQTQLTSIGVVCLLALLV